MLDLECFGLQVAYSAPVSTASLRRSRIFVDRSLQYLAQPKALGFVLFVFMTTALVCWIAHRSVVSLLSHGFTGCFCNGHRIVGIRRNGPSCMVAHPIGPPLNALNRELNRLLPAEPIARLAASLVVNFDPPSKGSSRALFQSH